MMQKTWKKVMVAAALASLPTAALAASPAETPKFWLTPFVGGYSFDGAEDVATGPVAGLSLDYNFTPRFSVEATAEMLATEARRPDSDVKFYRYALDLVYNLMPEKQLHPYLGAGFGLRTIKPEFGDSTATRGIADLGGGLKYRIPNSSMLLRLDLRYLAQMKDYERSGLSLTDHHANYEYTLGLMIPLCAKKAPAAPRDSDGDGVVDAQDRCPGTATGVKVDPSGCPLPAPAPAPTPAPPKDSDRDGVTDDQDQCPGTAPNVKVDATGCPLPAPAPVPMADSDQDGVPDSADQCPGTADGVQVNAQGCPLDSDGDGVSDANDQCPGTRAGLAVDRQGCPPPIEENLKIAINVLFASGKSTIDEASTADIKKLAEFMQTYPGTTTVIEGHTDNVGAAAMNKKLSQARAEAVRAYLIKNYGIDAGRISAVGYGVERPIADNATAAGRQKNRRIEAAIETTITKPQQ